jgi:glycosyltransferase involved in cell wall biosynthesis
MSYSENLTIQLSKTHRQLTIQTLFKKEILINSHLYTNVFYQNQVDAVKYSFTKPHKRIIRIHDMFPITNPEWFTKKSIYSFKKGIDNIEKHSIIFTNSIATSESFQSIIKAKEKKLTIFVVPCPTVKRAAISCLRCTFCKNPHLILKNQSYLLSVGTIEPRKNHINLLKAWRRSKNQRDYQTLVIVGKVGWKSQRIIREIRQSEGVIHFSDCCDAGLLKLYENSKAFITASLDEGFNIPLDEASQYGLKLLISDISVHRERFSRIDGLWFQADSVESMTMALQADPKIIKVQAPKISNFEEIFLQSFRNALYVD